MDAVFFNDLSLRAPDVQLHAGSGSHAAQLATMLLGIEPVLREFQPNWVVVQGDTNSTLAGALAAAKLNIPIAHIEAGCRSFNRAMPEEINRITVDHVSTLLLAPDETSAGNLRREGIEDERIEVIGSTGIDACLRAAAMNGHGKDRLLADTNDYNKGSADDYLLATVHRAENTTPERLAELVSAMAMLSRQWRVIFPVHPRTARILDEVGRPGGIEYLEPVGYARMMLLLRGARALLTDSGGLQEEGAVLGVPTFILRDETEWIEFVRAGRHRLVGTNASAIVDVVTSTLQGGESERSMRVPIGRERAGAANRIVAALARQQ
jgi:UDP-N-acetylglucosamine 2-epimerase (non-hydrolysing)